MTVMTRILLIGGLLLIGQIIIFWDFLSPIQWGQIKVSGLACTCPDEKVVNGRLYLRSITPDSLKNYNMDFSEIYVTQNPSSKIDPMGVDLYMIKGQIIGKERVSENDPWNPKVKVDQWKEVNLIKDRIVKVLFWGQLIIFGVVLQRTRKKTGA